jgi:hypothetical protein
MANDDQVAQLMKGVTAWNAWREENHTSNRTSAGRTSAGRKSAS